MRGLPFKALVGFVGFVVALKSVGHTMPSAVADLVDNAITYDATEVDITFGRPDAGNGRWMAISDNGSGMSPERLEEAMRIGGKSDYSGNSLGKYGFGLKGASWSQTKVFTVVTKEDGRAAHHMTWDAHDMGEWEVKSEPLEAWEVKATALKKHGTVVLWKDMKPPQSTATLKGLDPYSSEIAALERHLALVFHRFIEGKAQGRKPVAIKINGNRIAANNPVGHPLAKAYDLKPIKIPTESGEGRVHVQAFLLPSERMRRGTPSPWRRRSPRSASCCTARRRAPAPTSRSTCSGATTTPTATW